MKVGLIQGLWCFLEGYISKALGPRRNPNSLKRDNSFHSFREALEPPSQLDL
jgi:hypothetical protein